VSAKFAHQEPIICEALGLFEEGSGGKVADEGLADLGGSMPVCPSGGGLGAYVFSANGLVRVAECVAPAGRAMRARRRSGARRPRGPQPGRLLPAAQRRDGP